MSTTQGAWILDHKFKSLVLYQLSLKIPTKVEHESTRHEGMALYQLS